MLNEGIDIENENLEEKRPFLSQKQVGRLITKMGIEKTTENLLRKAIGKLNSGK